MKNNHKAFQCVKDIGYLASLFFVLACTLMSCNNGSHPDLPNVVVIVTDDQGYGDFSAHGNPYLSTPNMDKLHDESVRFTDFHVDPTCAPSRAALLTGKYAHRAGVWHTVSGGNHLRASEVTMAEVFQQNGYRTALFGKWHLGSNHPYRPMDRGFDEWLGQGDGGTGTTDDWFFNDRVDDHYWHNGERKQRDGFAPDVFYDAAIDYISRDDDKPFFIYLPTYLPHDPHTLPDTALAAHFGPDVPKYVSFFYAGIQRIDSNIGRLRQALEATGQAVNTIILFLTDNGGTAGVRLFNAGMRGYKGQVYEGGHRVPLFVHWPAGNLQHGSDVSQLTAHIDVLPSLIELCKLESSPLDFDGRSFVPQLFQPNKRLETRTLFVETQRTLKPKKWEQTAGMMGHWRLIDNQELYHLKNDPSQQHNVLQQHPEIASKIRKEHDRYWKRVTPNDREVPTFSVGHHSDPETFLTPSDWHLPKIPWNHAQVAAGASLAGSWMINVIQEGTYRIKASRWPLETNAPLQGVPNFDDKKADAWLASGAVNRLIYGNEMKALPIEAITFEVGSHKVTTEIGPEDTHISLDLKLSKGPTSIRGLMLDDQGQTIAGAYYVYLSKL
ncbi:arylsulfatase [Marinoscillum furvescens]|uniref:Arylsulfatase A-like enzyme n=1 Tax=Marinoscillum furvescens DSM 4134 TaxID=1122208 RepID=A0A3D9L399_MARFU|nr:arylsulfatase [Marinoscillum furvescens]RED96551.1 arylsulfatase A-like enzyme [Marinoscillum furvescens DSM 4134]